MSSAFADYSSRNSGRYGTLVAGRNTSIRKSKVASEQWTQARLLLLSYTAAEQASSLPEDNPQARDLVRRALSALQSSRLDECRDLLAQAEKFNSRQPRLWATYSLLEMKASHLEQSMADARKEIQFYPDYSPAYQQLAFSLVRSGHPEEAIKMLEISLQRNSENEPVAIETARLLLAAKRYAEVPPVLEKPITAAPANYYLQVLRVTALLHISDRGQAITEAKKMADASADPAIENDLAFALSEADADPGTARDLAQKAVSQTEKDSVNITLPTLESKDLVRINALSAAWTPLAGSFSKGTTWRRRRNTS